MQANRRLRPQETRAHTPNEMIFAPTGHKNNRLIRLPIVQTFLDYVYETTLVLL